MERLLDLAFWLENNFYREAFLIYDLLVKQADISVTKNQNRQLFQQQFPNEKPQKVFAIADQYFDNFKDQPDFQQKIQTFQNLNDVVNLIKNKPKLSPKEQIIQDLKNEYPQLEQQIKILVNSTVQPKNYEWVIKILNSQEQDNIQEIVRVVETYQRYENEIDDNGNKIIDRGLYDFNLMSDLRTYLDAKLSGNKNFYLKSIENHAMDPANTNFIYNSDNFIVVISGTVQSSQYWARGTTWCTSYIDNNMFPFYSRNMFLYYIITKPTSKYYDKADPMRKICAGYQKNDNDEPVLETENNATVDTNNHKIDREIIAEYLRDESDRIFASIENDVKNRDITPYNESVSKLPVQDFLNSVNMITDPTMRRHYESEFAENPHCNSEILKYLIISSGRYSTKHYALINPGLSNNDFIECMNELIAQNRLNRSLYRDLVCSNIQSSAKIGYLIEISDRFTLDEFMLRETSEEFPKLNAEQISKYYEKLKPYMNMEMAHKFARTFNKKIKPEVVEDMYFSYKEEGHGLDSLVSVVGYLHLTEKILNDILDSIENTDYDELDFGGETEYVVSHSQSSSPVILNRIIELINKAKISQHNLPAIVGNANANSEVYLSALALINNFKAEAENESDLYGEKAIKKIHTHRFFLEIAKIILRKEKVDPKILDFITDELLKDNTQIEAGEDERVAALIIGHPNTSEETKNKIYNAPQKYRVFLALHGDQKAIDIVLNDSEMPPQLKELIKNKIFDY